MRKCCHNMFMSLIRVPGMIKLNVVLTELQKTKYVTVQDVNNVVFIHKNTKNPAIRVLKSCLLVDLLLIHVLLFVYKI